MNQRFRQLAEQVEWRFADRLTGEFSEYDKRLIRFADLIVRECLEQIDKIRDGCEADNEDQQALGADWAGLAVARHFGVEE